MSRLFRTHQFLHGGDMPDPDVINGYVYGSCCLLPKHNRVHRIPEPPTDIGRRILGERDRE